MKCPACGKENPAGEQYCLDCGSDLSAAPAAAAATIAGASGAGSSPAGAGSLAYSDAEFQRMLQTPPTPTTCPHCGAAAPVSGAFCDNCGQPLTDQPPAGAAAEAAPAAATTPATPPQAAVPTDQQAPAPAPADSAAAPTMSIPAPPSPPSGLQIAFDLSGPAASSRYEMQGDEVTIGRRDAESGIYPELDFDGNDIVIEAGERVHAVSRRHGRIFREGDVLKFEDLGSTNGSTINGAAVLAKDPQPLKDGDIIVLGRTCRITVHVA
ncbi:MAG TPA: FHA domain-containing protein [Dehalococcoidia bacterium]|nr:FHA domain-containing protein [Dehalococcoidia bacterium]